MLKAPSLSKQMKEQQLLWFSSSNSYVIVDEHINELINLFVTNTEKSSFISAASKTIGVTDSQSEIFYDEINQLFSTNTFENKNTSKDLPFDASFRAYSETYIVNGAALQVNYSHKRVKEILHPQIAHLVSEKSNNVPQTIFDIFYANNTLYFYKNTVLIDSYEAKNYHVLQGNFCMQLLCVLHGKTEDDWLGTIHASTVTNDKEAILVIGKSGRGKSTFTAHAMAAGMNLVADDFSPILAKNKQVYTYPAAISIKSGAFESLSKMIPGFDELPLIFKGEEKGSVKFVVPFQNKNTKPQQSYPCQKMVSIHYKPESKTELKEIPFSEAMEIFVPDSWISPKEVDAKEFMDWIEGLSFYELTYSDTPEALEVFSKLFNSQG
ncbi:hypothetical protein [Formosa sp. Hel1_33_131]|uniref:hypothetical protein n=1 Tax=Formosa sp. Hel1_33_131 TaxID=1336794 RepID=UPI00084E0B69|nr:hypothetical protein [Formosa sp. Hel1_33_131]